MNDHTSAAVALRPKILLALALAGVCGISVQAQSTWTDASSDTLASTAGNWSPNGVPATGSDLTFGGTPGSPAVTLTAAFTINSATFNGATAFQINGYPANNSWPLTINSYVTDNSTGPSPINFSIPVILGGNVTVTSNATQAGSSLVMQSTIAGNGHTLTIVNSGASLIQLNGMYTGGSTVIQSGTLTVGNGAIGGAMLSGNVANSGTLAFVPASTDNLTYFGTISGAGNVIFSGVGSINLAGPNTYTGTTTINSGTVADSASNAFAPASVVSVNGGASLNVNFAETIGGLTNGASEGTVNIASSAGLTIANAASTGTSFMGTIAGSGSLTISGPGTQEFTANSDFYTGPITVSGGTLETDANHALGSSAVSIASGATLFVIGGQLFVESIAGSGTINLAANSLITGAAGTSTTFSGAISGGSGVPEDGLVKTGGGTLTLSGYLGTLGGITVGGGTLSISSAMPPNAGVTLTTNDSNIPFSNGAVTLLYTGPNATNSGQISIGAGINTVTIDVSGPGSLTFTTTNPIQFPSSGGRGGPITLTGTNTGNNSIAAPIGDSVNATSITKSGSGSWYLAGSNTYSGGTAISGGTLVAANGATGSATGTGGVSIATGAVLQIGDSAAAGGVTGNISNAGTVNFAGVGNETYGGVISDNGTAGLATVNGTSLSSTFTLSGANTYSGGTTISSGTLVAANTSGSATGTGNITIASGAALTIGDGGADGNVAGSIADSGSVTFSRSDALLNYGGAISGTGSMTVAGSGTITLGGANTYSGQTHLNSGTLADGADNSFSPNSLLTVSSSGNLDVNHNETLPGLYGIFTGGTTTIASLKTLTLIPTGIADYDGVVGGSGSINVAGTGSNAEQLDGNNTYSGGTTITGGELIAYNTSGSATGTGTVTINSGGTLLIGTAGAGRGIVTGNIIDNGSVSFARTDTSTYSGVISGTGTVSQSSAGTIVLTGANTYSGNTTVTGLGIMEALNPTGSATGTGALTVNSGAILQIGAGTGAGAVTPSSVTDNGSILFDRPDTVSFGSPISGTGGITIVGGGTVTVGGSFSYSGNTNVVTGTLADSPGNSFSAPSFLFVGQSGAVSANHDETVGGLSDYGSGNGSLVIGSASTFTVNESSFTTFSGVISGAGSFAKNGTGTLTLQGANTYGGATAVNLGTLEVINTSGSGTSSGTVTVAPGSTLQIGNSGSGGSVSGNIVDNGLVTFDRSNNITYSGAISGTGGVTQTGFGTLTLNPQPLSGTNTYSGPTIATNGESSTIADGAAYAFSPNSVVSINSNSTLIANFSDAVAGLGGTSSNASVSIVNMGTALTVGNSANNNPTFAGIISGAGALVKTGTSTQALSGANTYSGGTTINAGFIDATNATGSATGSGSVTIASGATLQIGAFGGGSTGSISGNVVDNGNLNFNLTAPATFGGNISGTGNLLQLSSNLLTLSGANTYSGNTNDSNGTLIDGAAGAFSPNSTMILGSGAVVNVTNNETIAGLAGSSPVPGLGASLFLGSGKTLTLVDAVANAFDGVISGAGSLVVAAGAGKQSLGGANTYAGGTTINSGGTLQLGTFTNNLSGTVTGSIVDNGTLIYNENGGGVNANAISGTGTVVVDGSSSVTVSAANTYTGGTTINGGSLFIMNTAGSATGPGSVTVSGPVAVSAAGFAQNSSPGALFGNGIITGSLTLNSGGIVVALFGSAVVGTGNGGSATLSPGILTVGSTAFGGGAGLGMVINDANGTAGSNWSLLQVNGPLAITATSASPFTIAPITLNQANSLGPIFDFNPATSYSWQVVNATGGITGFTPGAFMVGLNVTNTPGFQNSTLGGNFSVSEAGDGLFLNFTPIPEPSTWISLLGGSAAFAAFALWKRRAARA